MNELGADRSMMTECFQRLSDGWRSRGGLTLHERSDMLRALRVSLLQSRDAYVEAIDADFRGRSRHETLLTEIAVVVSAIDHTLPRLRKWSRSKRIALGWPFWPARGYVVPQPRGVVGVVAPSNYPLQLALMPLIGALSAGCRVMLKPSELAPRTAEVIASHLAKTFEPSIVGVVCGGADVARQFVRLPFDLLLFTGSPSVGAHVAAAAAERMTPLILELGGKSPVIIDRSANLADAARSVAAGKLMNAGQTCVAPDYVLVPRELHDEFVGHMKTQAAKLYPDAAARDYSALLSDKAIGRLQTIEANEKTVALLPGEIVSPRYAPKLILSPSPHGKAMTNEIFGPLLPILPYDTLDDVISAIRALPHPLALYWFGEQNAGFDCVMERTSSGTVSINETVLHAGISALPFGGIGRSGSGRYHGKAGFDAFSHERVVFHQSKWSFTKLLRPPFGATADRIIDHMLRRRR